MTNEITARRTHDNLWRNEGELGCRGDGCFLCCCGNVCLQLLKHCFAAHPVGAVDVLASLNKGQSSWCALISTDCQIAAKRRRKEEREGIVTDIDYIQSRLREHGRKEIVNRSMNPIVG